MPILTAEQQAQAVANLRELKVPRPVIDRTLVRWEQGHPSRGHWELKCYEEFQKYTT